MKRRDFIAAGTAGALGAGLSGCSSIPVKRQLSPHAFDKKVPKPAGTMPMDEIGTTGIKVSKFGFGSHMRKDIVPFENEREWMIREAYDLGVRLFDVYDHEQECYQYEPMGRHLKPMINDVVISISILPWDGRTLEQEFERDLRLFGRDYIDMVRIHSYNSQQDNWYQWEQLFKWKEQGKIRAVGIPIHRIEDVEEPLATYPLDYVIFPFNFYHNWTWASYEMEQGKFRKYDSLIPRLREKGVGVISMKPMAGDNLALPFKNLAAELDETGEINMAKASLRYVINSDMNVDTTVCGMYYPYHVYENIDAYFNPTLSSEEKSLMKKMRRRAKIVERMNLQPHYRFLADWAPDSWNDTDLA
jgi:predicted aldo/keto reductase-like oxidoreductase